MHYSSIILGLSGHYQYSPSSVSGKYLQALWRFPNPPCIDVHTQSRDEIPCSPAADVCRFLQWESIAMISLSKSHSTKAAVVFLKKNLFILFVTNLMIAEMRNQLANSPNLNKIAPTLDYNSGRWTEEESVYSHIFCHYSIDPFRLQQATCHLQIWVFPFLLRHWFKNHDFWSLS